MSEITRAPDVIEYWFAPQVQPLWFNATPEFDAELRERFMFTWEAAREGHLSEWTHNAVGALALTIVLDQFPLNMFRGLAQAYATEASARDVAHATITAGWDAQLSGVQKMFLYLPFMHSEILLDQDFSVQLFERAGLLENLNYARHHRDIVRRFGRFPHRNVALGRVSTAEEVVYLNSPEVFHG